MFGYVIPNQKELKVGQLEEYRSWYCGLCRCLQGKYGIIGRFSLSYDMTFLGMLLSSLYEPERTSRERTCIAHPFTRQRSYHDIYLEYAADMNILLNYYKCLDDWRDDHNLIKIGYGALLCRGGRRVAKTYPQKAKKIKRCLGQLTQAEQERTENLDLVAGLFGEICGCLFACREDEWRECLYRLGFYLGKFIYLMDAWEDWEEDLKKEHYNPLFYYFGGKEVPQYIATAEIEDKVHQVLMMMIAEACRWFERLPIIENAEILRNILYSGVWCQYYRHKRNQIEKRAKRTQQ